MLQHSTGSRSNQPPRILLTGVFGPFARDDEYGSRAVNPMELYHNQVTRVQGPFSLRMFHRTFSLLMIEANIDAPVTILDFPTLDRFIDEISTESYDIIGISAIIPNIGKVQKMCEEIRELQPKATIVVGGHIANKPGIETLIDTDHICKGDGIRWFREYLGQDIDAPILHPAVVSGFGTRVMGIPIADKNTAGVLIPSVGCPVGCNFCSTSALFGGKGNCINFHETGEELFSILCRLEKTLRVESFFVLDENFLLYKKRALRLLELMEQHDKSWTFYIFSSARVLRSYTIDQLIRLGISWVWMGLEGRDSKYGKLNGVDTMALVNEFQEHGIRVLGSTIIGMEEHTPDNLDEAIAYAVGHRTDFHQFMLYTPMPGTPLFQEHLADRSLLSDDECPPADVHGQERFNYRHPSIPSGMEKEFLLGAFRRDYLENGPSIARIIRTTLKGWRRYKNHPDARVVRRIKAEIRGFNTIHTGTIRAMMNYFRNDPHLHAEMRAILDELHAEFGWVSRLAAPIISTVLGITIRREEERLNRGWTYEPPVIYQKNAAAIELDRRNEAPARFKSIRLNLPVYDHQKVVACYHERVEEARAGMLAIRDRASEQLTVINERMRERTESIQQQFRRCKTDFNTTRGQLSDQVFEMYDRFMAQCEVDRAEVARIQEQMNARTRHMQEELIQAREFMVKKYGEAREQIIEMSDQMADRYASLSGQLTQAVEQTREQLRVRAETLRQLLAAEA